MEKKQAQEFIKQVLNSRFDQEQFELFVRNLLNEFEPRDNNYSGNLIPEAFRNHITHYKRIGKYIDPDGEPMDILIVQTRSVNKLERTRTALRNFVVRHLKNFDKYYALVAFYSKEDDGREWRLSLVKIDIETERTEKGKIKAKEEIVPAKRFSYLVGDNEHSHTAQKQLLPLMMNTHSNPLIIKEKDGDGSVEGAFSIEKVTDEFYEQYKELYLKLTENAALTETLETEGLDSVRFVKKLLGQIVFLYFLQKKGWLGVAKDQKMGQGSKHFLRDKFEEISETSLPDGQEGSNYFNGFLRYLFYDALAKEHNDEGIKYYNKRLGCKIPFLNGGLFEADYENWATLDLNIDNLLFSNPNEKTKAGDKGTGILDVFDRYNFTIREDEPLEKEVAVDPEMLGKIYEKLFAEQKKHGAFYTPREIVHYMCQESLIHYLDNSVNHYIESYQSIDSDQTSLFGGSSDNKGNQPGRPAGLKIEFENKGGILIQKEQIEKYIRKSTTALENDEDYFEAQARIKRGEIKSTDKKLYLNESIYSNSEKLDKALADIKICDPAIGSGAFPVGLLHEIVSARKVLRKHLSKNYLEKLDVESLNDLTDYYYKRHAIQESIYGVDIDASAIDIARLRLWLSMIVDEEDYETIETLPNLDYKIVCGNSLIGFPKDWQSPAFDKIEALKNNFFDETDTPRKKELKRQIDTEIQKRLDTSERVFGYKVDFDFKLSFSEVWHFNNGFDVVIGNPPYVNIYSIEPYQKEIFKKLFDTSYKKYDLFVLFFEKGLNLLRDIGSLNLITSNKYFSQPYGLKLRRLLLKNRIEELVNFRFNVFSATVDTAITHISKRNSLDAINVLDVKEKTDYNSFLNSEGRVSLDLKFIRGIPENMFRIEVIEKDISIIKRIQEQSIDFSEVCYINYGCRLVSKNGQKKKKDYIFDTKETPNLKKFIEGSDVRKYKIQSSRYVDYQPTEHYLSLFSELFQSNKLVSKDVIGKDGVSVAFDSIGYYNDHTVINAVRWCDLQGVNYSGVKRQLNGLKIKKSNEYSYSELLGVINSELSNYYFNKLYNIDLHFYPGTFQKMFLPNGSNNELKIYTSYIVFLAENEGVSELMFSFFKTLNDAIVYNLFLKEELQSANKQILPHLGDLKPITEDMSEEEKLAIIQSEFERLYDPNHPVRNNLETLDSVEEVRIIKEALK